MHKDMKKLTAKQWQRQLESLAAIADSDIDTFDIPELTGEQLQLAVRGQMYGADAAMNSKRS
jgi:hypothetical protein